MINRPLLPRICRSTIALKLSLIKFIVCLACASLWGCTRASREPEAADTPPASAPVSNIPLRVWIVAPILDEQLWLRHWLASSEQTVELRSLTGEELLQQAQCDCDVILYPARDLGELQARKWITKLPFTENPAAAGPEAPSERTVASESSVAADSAAFGVPIAWKQQATYGGEVLAVPLGCGLPVFVASDHFPPSNEPLTWEAILQQLKLRPLDKPQFELGDTPVDRHALLDRYFAIAATLVNRDPNYGLLFDLQSMKSRLAEPHFEQALDILAGLAGQPNGLAAVVGDHSTAWQWATSQTQPAMSIAVPALLHADAAKATGGQLLSVVSNHEDSTQRPKITSWNGGGGLLASLSANCRQSNQASLLLRWLSEPGTRSVLARFAAGIEASAGGGDAESLAWKSRQRLVELAASPGIALEPRLPGSHDYRLALAEEVLEFLQGKQSSQQTLQAVAARWQAITAAAGPAQRNEYEASLGLTL